MRGFTREVGSKIQLNIPTERFRDSSVFNNKASYNTLLAQLPSQTGNKREREAILEVHQSTHSKSLGADYYHDLLSEETRRRLYGRTH